MVEVVVVVTTYGGGGGGGIETLEDDDGILLLLLLPLLIIIMAPYHAQTADLMTKMQSSCQRERDSSHQSCRRFERTKTKKHADEKETTTNEKVQKSKTP